MIILPLSKAIELLNWTAKIHRCDSLYWEWVQCVNGNCDIEHIYIKNRAFSKVPFLKGTKDEDKLEDTKFNRRISKYKAVNQYTIYRATCFGKNSSKAFYFIENNDFNNVYFAGIDDQIRTTLWCMYNCDEAELKSSNSYFIPNFLEIPSK